jgi:hypothetical protein
VTRKEARRRLAAALREQRAAQEEVRGANARVVEATSKLPPHYVDEHRRLAPDERERIQNLIDRAQKASNRLASATADVVNLRSLVASEVSYRDSSRAYAMKKQSSRSKAAPLASVSLAPLRSKAATVLVYGRPSGYWYAQAHDATTGAQITDASGYSREKALRALREKFAMIGVAIKSITDEDPYTVGRSSHHATKKSAALLQREIDGVLASAHSPELEGGRLVRETHATISGPTQIRARLRALGYQTVKTSSRSGVRGGWEGIAMPHSGKFISSYNKASQLEVLQDLLTQAENAKI